MLVKLRAKCIRITIALLEKQLNYFHYHNEKSRFQCGHCNALREFKISVNSLLPIGKEVK